MSSGVEPAVFIVINGERLSAGDDIIEDLPTRSSPLKPGILSEPL